MEKNKEVSKGIENWVPVSKSVSEIENVIHGIGEKLASLFYKKILSDETYDTPHVKEERREKITIEFICDQSDMCLILKMNGFIRRYVYDVDFSIDNHMHKILECDRCKEVVDIDNFRRE